MTGPRYAEMLRRRAAGNRVGSSFMPDAVVNVGLANIRRVSGKATPAKIRQS